MKRNLQVSILILILVVLSNPLKSQPGANDPAFNAGDLGFAIGTGFDVTQNNVSTLLQPDGKVVIGGDFNYYNQTARKRIVRINTDGSVDHTFNPGAGVGGGGIYTMALQPDGKILIGGDFTTYDGVSRRGICRINSNGTIDLSFNPGTGIDNVIMCIQQQNDGKLIVGGSFMVFNGVPRKNLVRLNPDGSADPSFNTGLGPDGLVQQAAVQPDGKVLIGGGFNSYNGSARPRLVRLNADGTLDMAFNAGNAGSNIRVIRVLSSSKIIVAGTFSVFNSALAGAIVRLNSDGTRDNTFSGAGAGSSITSLEVQSDDKLLIAGDFNTYNGTARRFIARINTDGSIDNSFDAGTINNTIRTICLQADGKVIAVGNFTLFNGKPGRFLARVAGNGAVDLTYNPVTGADNGVYVCKVLSDEKILLAGLFTGYNNTSRNSICRINTDGTLDPGFNPGTGADNTVWAATVQSDGKILIGGDFANFDGTAVARIVRLNSDGSRDAGFSTSVGPNNTVHAIAVQPDGKIIIAGNFTALNSTPRNRIARLSASGIIDGTLNIGAGFDGLVLCIAVQPDGKILVGGSFITYNGITSRGLVRLNTDGSLDGTFNIGSGVNGSVDVVTIQPDGKILAGGFFSVFNGTSKGRIVRLNADGSIDAGFNTGTGANMSVRSIGLQNDGKVVIGGYFTSLNGVSANYLARLNADGSRDAGFVTGTGPDSDVEAVAVAADGKILIAGWFTAVNGTGRNRVARIGGNTPMPLSYLRLTVNRKGAGADIRWLAGQEVHLSHYIVQHSSTGNAFSTIGVVNAIGPSGADVAYALLQPFVNSNKQYYRVIGIDKDGASTFSPVAELRADVAGFRIALQPVPANNHLNVAISGLKADRASLLVTGMSGTVYRRKEVVLRDGAGLVDIDVTSLPPGSYIISVHNGSGTQSSVFVKYR